MPSNWILIARQYISHAPAINSEIPSYQRFKCLDPLENNKKNGDVKISVLFPWKNRAPTYISSCFICLINKLFCGSIPKIKANEVPQYRYFHEGTQPVAWSHYIKKWSLNPATDCLDYEHV